MSGRRLPSAPSLGEIPIANAVPVYRQHVMPNKYERVIARCVDDLLQNNGGVATEDIADRMRSVVTRFLETLESQLSDAQSIKDLRKAYELFIDETLLESLNDSAAGSEKDDVFFLNNITAETRDLFLQTTKKIAFENELRIERQNGPRTRYTFVTKSVNRNDEDIDRFYETEFGEIFIGTIVNNYVHPTKTRFGKEERNALYGKKPQSPWYKSISVDKNSIIELYGIYASIFGIYAQPIEKPNAARQYDNSRPIVEQVDYLGRGYMLTYEDSLARER